MTKPEARGAELERALVEAATPAAAGTPAPRVRLTEGATGKDFDSASLGSEPYAVVFITIRCDAIGDYLRQVAAELGPGEGAVLGDLRRPRRSTPRARRSAWPAKHRSSRAAPSTS